MTTDKTEQPDALDTPIMPTGSGVADLEMVRELDAIADGDAGGDEVAKADQLKE